MEAKIDANGKAICVYCGHVAIIASTYAGPTDDGIVTDPKCCTCEYSRMSRAEIVERLGGSNAALWILDRESGVREGMALWWKYYTNAHRSYLTEAKMELQFSYGAMSALRNLLIQILTNEGYANASNVYQIFDSIRSLMRPESAVDFEASFLPVLFE